MKRYIAKAVSVAATVSIVASMSLPAVASTFTDRYVDVTADVNSSLAFEIVKKLDLNTIETACGLGVLSMGSVSNCGYNLRISTNYSSGFTAGLRALTRLATSTHNFNDVADGAVTAGQEEYGINITSSTAGGWTAPNTYDGDSIVAPTYNGIDAPVPYAPAATSTAVSFGAAFDGYAGGTGWSSSTLTYVEHRASINNATPFGHYTQRVYWEVVALP